MKKLVVLGGTGDVYLVCALAAAFRDRYGPCVVVTRAAFEAVCHLFPGVPYELDEPTVRHAEGDRQFQIEHDNRIEDDVFYTHPCFERSRVRVDHLTVKNDVSQADMYRMLLRLPPETPLATPMHPPGTQMGGRNQVLIIPEAVSWPNTQPQFWTMLHARLRASGWDAYLNDPTWSLGDIFKIAVDAEWVIGPQCGVMSILCTGSFPCRKTLATPSVDDYRAPGFLASQTFPYAYVTKFANNDYDVEEFKITIENRAEIVEAIATGLNSQRVTRHNPLPLPAITVSMMPGEVLDRLAVLTVKRHRFPPRRRAAVEREYRRYLEVARTIRALPGVEALLQQLILWHERAYDVLETIVPVAMSGNALSNEQKIEMADGHIHAIKLNRVRVDLRRTVDEVCGCAVSEVKSYYNPEDQP